MSRDDQVRGLGGLADSCGSFIDQGVAKAPSTRTLPIIIPRLIFTLPLPCAGAAAKHSHRAPNTELCTEYLNYRRLSNSVP